MKKAEVKIGRTYHANIKGEKLVVKIESSLAGGGWNASDVNSDRSFKIATAAQLEGPARVSKKPTVEAAKTKEPTVAKATKAKAVRPKGDAKVTVEGNLTVVECEPATVMTLGAESSPPVDKPKAKGKVKKAISEEAPTKLSCIEAALKVLGESDGPLNTKQMIDAMGAKGYWTSPGGKTPHATLYSAILRELSKDNSRFVKVEKGRFAIESKSS